MVPANYTYTPTQLVKDIHLHTWRGPGPREFDVYNWKYWLGVGWMPLILMIVGGLCLYLWCCLRCCKRKKGIPSSSRICLRFFCAVCCVFAVGACFFGGWQNYETNKVMLHFRDSLNSIINSFNNATTDVTTINQDLSTTKITLDDVLEKPACQDLPPPVRQRIVQAQQALNEAIKVGQEVENIVQPISSPVSTAQTWFDRFVKWRNIGTYVVLGVAAAISLTVMICVTVLACDACSCLTHGVISILVLGSTFIVTALWWMSGGEFLVAITGADVCYAPSTSIQSVFTNQDSTFKQVIDYYTTTGCNATEPDFINFLHEAKDNITEIANELQLAHDQAPADKKQCAPLPLIADANQLVVDTTDLLNLTSCANINGPFINAVDRQFCTKMLPPLVQLLAAGIAAAIFLLLVCATAKYIANEQDRNEDYQELLSAPNKGYYGTMY